jgi:hypothetical protein
MAPATGKITKNDEMFAHLWKWLPWVVFLLILLPAPIVFSVLLLAATSPESAAFHLAFAVLSLGISGLIGLIVLLILILFRKKWFRKLRNKLAEDGITAGEVPWFTPELTSAERNALFDIKQQNLLLADAYCETLATRLTASRILARARDEQLRVERRLNRARSLSGADTVPLINDLQRDHEQLEKLRNEAASRLSEAKARLQVIEAAASRSLNQKETNLMLRRLSDSQNQIPLAMELVRMEQEAHREVSLELKTSPPMSNESNTR